jgi:3-oxoadipate enol-lactonase
MTARLHAVEDGPAGAPVLVLGPSLGTDTGLFDPQVAEFSRTHRVLRYDLRGHGGSQVVPGPCTIADLAGDVLALLDDLDVDRFCYAGVSIGGAIGQQLALTVPDRLDRLAIIASAARFADPPSWTVRAAQVREQGTEVLVPSRTGTWFTAEWAEQEPAAAERLLDMLTAVC